MFNYVSKRMSQYMYVSCIIGIVFFFWLKGCYRNLSRSLNRVTRGQDQALQYMFLWWQNCSNKSKRFAKRVLIRNFYFSSYSPRFSFASNKNTSFGLKHPQHRARLVPAPIPTTKKKKNAKKQVTRNNFVL